MSVIGDVLYADVADTLGPDVRRAIEIRVALPCRVALTGEHIWDTAWVSNEEGVRTGLWLSRRQFCVYCGSTR